MNPKDKISNNYHHPIWLRSTENRLRALDRFIAQIGGIAPGTRVLDFGAGHGAFSHHFAKAGHPVTPIEPRKESIEIIKRDYGLTAIPCDLDRDFPKIEGKGYFTLLVGILYHLEHPERLMEKAAALSDHVVIETACLDHDGVAIVRVDEDREIVGYSINGVGSRPSPGWLIHKMKSFGFNKVVDLSTEDLNIPSFQGDTGNLYTWEFQRTCGWRRGEQQLRKMYGFSR